MKTEVQASAWILRLDGLCHLPLSSSGVLGASTNIIADLMEKSGEIATVYDLHDIFRA